MGKAMRESSIEIRMGKKFQNGNVLRQPRKITILICAVLQ